MRGGDGENAGGENDEEGGEEDEGERGGEEVADEDLLEWMAEVERGGLVCN